MQRFVETANMGAFCVIVVGVHCDGLVVRRKKCFVCDILCKINYTTKLYRNGAMTTGKEWYDRCTYTVNHQQRVRVHTDGGRTEELIYGGGMVAIDPVIKQ
jgi:hypothetical protein